MTLSQDELVASLEGIKNDGFAVPGGKRLDDLLENMIMQIGNPNGYLRDDLIYETLASWISGNMLGIDRCNAILGTCISDDFIMYRIDTNDEDAVYRRSFAMLAIASLLELDERIRFIDGATVKNVFARVCMSYGNEKNLEGYVAKKGWAHSVAHTADVFELIVKRPEIGDGDIERLLSLITMKFQNNHHYFVDNEDERTARVIRSVIEHRESCRQRVCGWIRALADYEKPEEIRPRQTMRGNVRNLLRSIYFCTDDAHIRTIVERSLQNSKW